MPKLQRLLPAKWWSSFLWIAVSYIVFADILPNLLLLLINCSGYLPYSDRPGPGWQSPHLPSKEELNFFLGFAYSLIVPTAIYSAGFGVIGLLFGLCSLPRWLTRLIGSPLAFIASGFMMMAAGWMIAISAVGIYTAAICGLIWGLVVLPLLIVRRTQLLLANGKLDKQIVKSQKSGTTPADLGKRDALIAVAAAKSEGFPSHATIFLDQEEGGRLLPEQAEYLLGWTEAVAASDYKPGVYASGQPVSDGPGKTIDTIQHIRSMVKERHLHEVAAFSYQDACPPAPGCTLHPKPLNTSGELDLTAWQYAQSPRRPENTAACKRTYDADGNCYVPGFPTVFLDLDAATSADPSNGR